MMNFTVTGRHLVVSDAVHEQVQKKLSHLHRLLNDSAISAQCVISQQRQLFTCELTLHARGDHMLVGVGKHTRAASAVAAAAAKVEQQALRLSDRWKTRRKDAGRPVRDLAPADDQAPEAQTRVIRSRRYAVKPMSVDDAVLALSKGDQTFLVFRDASSESL
ncbi:MAG: HPF/RaiA family ribosome-associated protein, partial [Vicinamibacterales bacterium]